MRTWAQAGSGWLRFVMTDLNNGSKRYLGQESRYDFSRTSSFYGHLVSDRVKVCVGVSSFVEAIAFDTRPID